MAGARAGRALARFYGSELALLFGRRRNQAGMLVLAAVPVLIAIAVKVRGGSGGGGSFLSAVTSNGLFVALVALTVELPLFLPLAVAATSADTVAGEAGTGTLRYLLVVPVSRARLLAVKYLAVVTFALACVLLIAAVGAGMGFALFGAGPVVLLSGTTVGTAAGLGRLLLVCLYLTVEMATVAAIGLFVSTLTEQAVGATIAILVVVVGSEIMDALPQVSAIHPFLPTHFWTAFGDFLRAPITLGTLREGLLSALAYVAVFTSAAWARFSEADVTS